MHLQLEAEDAELLSDLLADGAYASPQELIHDALERMRTERWVEANREEIVAFVEKGRNSPVLDMTLDELRDHLHQSIRDAGGA